MKMTKQTKKLSVALLSALLIAAMLICTVGCSGEDKKDSGTTAATVESPAGTTGKTGGDTDTADTASAGTTAADTAAGDGVTVLGEGATAFSFSVTDGDGNETLYEIHTDCATVGDALTELGLIEGEEGEFGLYVKKVCGIAADYDADGTYWAFYIDGEYAMTGVDATDITAGAAYAFKVES